LIERNSRIFSAIQQPFWHFNPVDIDSYAIFSDDFTKLMMTIIPTCVDIFGLPYIDNFPFGIENFIDTASLRKRF
jgi:hypothetical protein